MINKKLVLLNFSNVFIRENFYLNFDYLLIDCTNIRDTFCFCDEKGKHEILDAMNNLDINSIHFIDSGNYHYISEFAIEKITQAFILVVFDNHTDMYTLNYPGTTSCGSWVLDSLLENRYLKDIILIGSNDYNRIDPSVKDRVQVLDNSQLIDCMIWKEKYNPKNLPIYMSIDKDVLDESEIITNWNQGNMKFIELSRIIRIIKHENIILGVDICGEPYVESTNEIIKMDNDINAKLIDIFFQKNKIIK